MSFYCFPFDFKLFLFFVALSHSCKTIQRKKGEKKKTRIQTGFEFNANLQTDILMITSRLVRSPVCTHARIIFNEIKFNLLTPHFFLFHVYNFPGCRTIKCSFYECGIYARHCKVQKRTFHQRNIKCAFTTNEFNLLLTQMLILSKRSGKLVAA